jgi:polyribonucleotide nucleotidyltransferase
VHASVCTARKFESKETFLQLVVEYKQRSHATGTIPLTFNRRDGRCDEDIIAARLVDRSIRPLFPHGYLNDIQIIVTVQAVDGAHDPLVIAVNAVSAALIKSGLPWNGPLGCVRVGCVDGELVANPTIEQMRSSSLDLIYSGSSSSLLM